VSRVAVGLAAIVVAATLTYGGLGTLLRGPSVFGDELIYMDATRSIASGHRPMERDQTYGRGLLYPALAAPVLAVAPNQLDGYRALKWFNAFLFALSAIPAYLLARRLLRPGWSLAVATLAVAVPSAVYAGMVLTESAAYLTGTLALLALALVVERPSARRQLGALGALALAALARPQLAAFAVAFPVGLGVRWLLLPRASRPGVEALRRLWPTAAAVGAAGVLAAVALASGRASLRDYSDVWTSYDLLAVARWSWYTLGDLALYLAVLPLLIAPAALLELWGRGRRGSTRDGAFLGVFAAVNVVTVLIVAAFSSATFGGERLHDRYLFYVLPLWLVLFAVWLDRGAVASRALLAVGAALAVALVATLPTGQLLRDTNYQFDAVATALWSRVREVDPSRPGVLRLLLVVAVLAGFALAVAARRPPASARIGLLVPILVVFGLNAAFVWDSRVTDADVKVFADDRPATWSWVDHAVPADVEVTDVVVESGRCLAAAKTPFRWTEFFNERITPVLRIGVPEEISTDGRSVRIGADGIVRRLDGPPVVVEYAVAPPGVLLQGREIARGTLAHLRLWKVDGVLRIVNARSNAQALVVACPEVNA
jgi:hypothetical protein